MDISLQLFVNEVFCNGATSFAASLLHTSKLNSFPVLLAGKYVCELNSKVLFHY